MGPDAAELKEQMEALGGIAFAVEAFARATEEQRKNETLEAMRSASARTERSRSIDRRRSSLRDIFEMVATVKAVKKAGASRPKRGSLEVNTSIEDGEPPERARSNSLSPSDPGSPRRADPPTPLSDEDVCRLPSADSEGGEPGNGGCNGHLGNGGGGAALGGGTGGPATPNGVRVPEGRTALGGSVSQRQSWVPQSRLSVGEAGWFDKRVTSSAAEQQDPAAIRRGWRQRGLLMLARGEIAALVLAGGQGTRLGSSDPKGMYDIGLPSGRSLFQLQAERILRLQELCREQTLGKSNKWTRPIPWYVMTGPSTDLPTREYFRRMDFFGLRRDQVFFFCQGCLPAFSPQGQVLMEGIGRVSVAPDGNGGLYRALKASGALEDLRRRGVRGVDCYCVDNALAQFLDPEFLGYCDVNKAEVAARAVPKRGAEERVGVFAKCGGRLRVMEYTELDPALAVLRDPVSHQLVFNWSNICMQYFSTEFLAANHDFFENQGRYHIAQKRIQTIDGEVDGIKLEAFIFDTFVTAERAFVFEVEREEQFAPVKNRPGAGSDTPEAARRQLMLLHADWIRRAGGTVEGEGGLEVSQSVSIAGEGLEELCAGKTFAAGSLVVKPAGGGDGGGGGSGGGGLRWTAGRRRRLLTVASAAGCVVLGGLLAASRRGVDRPAPSSAKAKRKGGGGGGLSRRKA